METTELIRVKIPEFGTIPGQNRPGTGRYPKPEGLIMNLS